MRLVSRGAKSPYASAPSPRTVIRTAISAVTAGINQADRLSAALAPKLSSLDGTFKLPGRYSNASRAPLLADQRAICAADALAEQHPWLVAQSRARAIDVGI